MVLPFLLFPIRCFQSIDALEGVQLRSSKYSDQRRPTLQKNGRFKVVDDKGNEVSNEAILKPLAKPNWFQAGKEFVKQSTIFKEIQRQRIRLRILPFRLQVRIFKALFTLAAKPGECGTRRKNLLFPVSTSSCRHRVFLEA